MNSIVTIDESLFLDTYEVFEEHLLPLVQKQRDNEGLSPLSSEESMDYYLDLRLKYNVKG